MQNAKLVKRKHAGIENDTCERGGQESREN